MYTQLVTSMREDKVLSRITCTNKLDQMPSTGADLEGGGVQGVATPTNGQSHCIRAALLMCTL